MPKRIQNKDVKILWTIVKESMATIEDGEFYELLHESNSMWNFIWNCDIENRSAIYQWSQDLIHYVERWDEKFHRGWRPSNVTMMAEYLAKFCWGHNDPDYEDEFYRHAENFKFYKQAPYLFWAPGRKLTAYFIGSDALAHSRKVARGFRKHCYENNFPDEIARSAYRNARHLVCTIAALSPHKLKTTDGYKYSCALQGKPVVNGFTKLPDEEIELYREYILLNKSPECMPDIVGMQQGE